MSITLNKKLHGENVVKKRVKSRVRSKKDSGTDQEGSESEVSVKEKFELVASGRKRKRIYAEEGVSETRKLASKKRHTQVKSGSFKGRKNNDPPRSIWIATRSEDGYKETGSLSRKVKHAAGSGEPVSGSSKSKKASRLDYDGNGLLKKQTKSKSSLSKSVDEDQSKYVDTSSSSSAKKSIRKKKGIAHSNSEVPDDQPKKKKRVIRLDPYDTSNKRLDDGITESTKQKKKEVEEDGKFSKNAQFRAIQPSPSILSFVEDNLLGRRRLIELKRKGYNIELSAPLDNVPFSTSPERERIEENIFRNKLEFFAAAKLSSSIPAPDIPEIAFAGRSNVGKSSLLNSLTRQWGVARTSDKPGLTQTINFFKLGPKLYLVDLPGYGFAYAKEEVKDAWEELVMEYVSTRVGLKRVCLLIDTKWGMKPRDNELIHLMERSQTKYQIVLTKTDLVFPIDVARRAMQIEESLKANKSMVQPVMMVSSKSGAGIRSLRTVLSKIARFAKI
ncbi:hypothetical protein K2173_023549 [Erythroxylum novogranatense]|uniref:EngB-type G domain-containing protein n=1 Tax=Erythroxylum novogranatense TaxID=1862640 RepID=A0AAV8TRP2_9ROSI|nr:hypothetical protein K2173_023549 [Erythroxylum novogranatense]